MPSKLFFEEYAPAKLNLNFKILKKFNNNYHKIESHIVFLPEIYDKLMLRKSSESKVYICGKYSSTLINSGGDTLIRKSIDFLSELLNININLEIHLEKNIPLNAGLGGGSADAAAAIRAIINIYKLNKKKKIIKENLYKIGSDVPVCFYCSNAKVTGMGNEIKPLKILKNKLWVLLIKPKSNYSTKLIYEKFNDRFLKESNFCFTLNNIVYDMNKYKNSLENTVCKIDKNVRNTIKKLPPFNNLTKPRITGSGSTIFITFRKKKEMFAYLKKIRLKNNKYWISTTFFYL